MAEFLAPGVFVEEVPFRARPIEGVPTGIAGFVGPTRFGPIDATPKIVTSLSGFERIYGGGAPLDFDAGSHDNYMWHAVRAFFEEGGKRLYVSRIFRPAQGDGAARPAGPLRERLDLKARFPGAAGNGRVTITLALGPDLPLCKGEAAAQGAVVHVLGAGHDGFYLLMYDESRQIWRISSGGHGVDQDIASTDSIRVRGIVASLAFESSEGGPDFAATGLPLDRLDLGLAATEAPIAIGRTGATRTGLALLDALAGLYRPADSSDLGLKANLAAEEAIERRSVIIRLEGGSDGALPEAIDYEGRSDPATGLKALEAIEDIAIVAAPGSSVSDSEQSRAVIAHLIGHAERMKYRIALIDSARAQSVAQARKLRARYDSRHAAFYYPWVLAIDPVSGQEKPWPPSGFVAGLYALSDAERGVHKAPANQLIRLATGLETAIGKAEQDVLNPEGVNVFRQFEGRGIRLWGARTMSSDPEWKYVSLRRYFAFLERSIDKGTQWAVFEPSGEALWADIRRTVSDFLLRQWSQGALLGDKPEKAYFVKCDRTTMTQSDLDEGRLVCLIGVAALQPAEFVLFRIGQWTADRKS